MLRRGGPTRGALALTGAAVVLALSVGCQQQEQQSPAPTSSRPSATATPAQVLTTPSPIGLAIAGDGLWVANSGSGDVSRLTVPQVSRPVGDTPLRLAGDGHGQLWATVFGAGELVQIDPASGSITRRVELDGQPEGVTVAYGSVWVVRQQARVLTRLTLTGRRIGDVPLGSEPRLVGAGAGALWVPDVTDGTLTRVDPTGKRAPRTVPVCDGAQDVAVHRAIVWVTCTRAGQLVAVDPRSMTVTGRLALSGEPDGIDGSGERLWVALATGPGLVEVDPQPGHPGVLSRQQLGTAPPMLDRANVDVVAAEGRVWVSSVTENRVYSVPLPAR